MSKSTSINAKVKIRDGKKLYIYYRNQMWSLGITVSPTNEDGKKLSKEDEKKLLKNNTLTSYYKGSIEERAELNLLITTKLNLFNSLITQALNKNVDTLDYLYTYFKQEEIKLKKLRITKNTLISEAFELWLMNKKNEMKDFKKERSFERYVSELSRLKDYNKVKLSKVGEIDLNWVLDYMRYLSKPFTKEMRVIDNHFERDYKVKKVLKQTNSTIIRTITDLISCLKDISLNEPELRFDFKSIYAHLGKLKTPKDDKENIIALTRLQWEAYKDFEKDINHSRDWEVKTYYLYRFCVQTGMRYSDVIQLDDSFVKDDIITMYAQKTDNRFDVPMNLDCVRIFNMFGRSFIGKFPKNQQINKNLRKVFSKIKEFNKELSISEYSLNAKITKKVKVLDIMTFHSSRRSFISFLIQNNPKLSLIEISRLVGWSDLRSIENYMKVFGDKNESDKLLVNW